MPAVVVLCVVSVIGIKLSNWLGKKWPVWDAKLLTQSLEALHAYTVSLVKKWLDGSLLMSCYWRLCFSSVSDACMCCFAADEVDVIGDEDWFECDVGAE